MVKSKSNNKTSPKLVMYSLTVVAIFCMATSCFKPEVPEQTIKVYPAGQDITNPPDTFIVRMNLYYNVGQQATLSFDESAVWKISQTPTRQYQTWIHRQDNDEIRVDFTSQTEVGFQETTKYTIWGLNNKYNERRILDLKFKKTTTDYDSFDPKL